MNNEYNIMKQKIRFKLTDRYLVLLICFLGYISTVSAQSHKISGVVVDEGKSPIIGATIQVKGANNGTITDIDGNFSLEVKNPKAQLQISYIGFTTITVPVQLKGKMTITMQEASRNLDEVVVIGYGTVRKSDLSGSVSAVSMKNEAEIMPITSADQFLQGRIAGVSIAANSGAPGAGMNIQIRGVSTLSGNTDPLYVVDGFPIEAATASVNGGTSELSQQPAMNPLASINPNDIESIQVLKDAASASIYGSRAANGVIIITTKQGRKGQIKINFDASVSASMYQSKLDMMNTEQYGRTLWQANVNSGKNPNANSIGYQYDWGYNAEGYPVLDNIYVPKFIDDANTIATGDTDWFDEITRTGFIQQYNLSLSNGTERGNYFFSLGYYKNDGLIKYTNFDRISARINSDYKVIDNILTIGEHFTLNRTTEVQAPGNIMSDAMIALPMIPVHTVDGTNWGGPNSTMPDRQNVARIIYDNRNNRYTYWRLFGDAYVNLNPVKGLNIRSTFGLDYAQKYQRNFTLPYNTGFLNSDKDAVEMKQEHFTKWMWNAVATYELEIGKHRGDVMAGMELNREDDINFATYREGFAILTPDYMYPSAGVGQSQASGGAGGFSLVSFFGKLNYSYADKYLLSRKYAVLMGTIFENCDRNQPNGSQRFRKRDNRCIRGSALLCRAFRLA